MSVARLRLASALVLVAGLLSLSACGKTVTTSLGSDAGGGTASGPRGAPTPPPPVAPAGTVSLVTQDTVRIAGASPIDDAAAVARAVFPGAAAGSAGRPAAVTLVDAGDWPAAVAASALMSSPLRAPVLFSDGARIPPATASALRALSPVGAPALGGAQAIRLGSAAAAPGLRVQSLASTDSPVLAAQIEGLVARVRGTSPRQVLIVNSEASPAWAMPAAGLAAESGAPVLFVNAAGIPAQTRVTLRAMGRPNLYLIGPSAAIDDRTARALSSLGTVKRIAGATPVDNAIAVARYLDATFGWGVVDPGHGLVFANAARPLDAAAAAALANGAQYGPLLLLADGRRIPSALSSYLGSIQPAYTSNPRFAPVRGVYNRGWLMGDAQAISVASQAGLDSLLRIVPSNRNPVAPSVVP